MTYVLTAEDIAALRNFAAEHGPKWKDALHLDWYNARLSHCQDMPERGTILHGLRNNLGPSWLCDFTFAEPIIWPNLRKLRASEVNALIQELAPRERNSDLTDDLRVMLGAARRERRRRASR